MANYPKKISDLVAETSELGWKGELEPDQLLGDAPDGGDQVSDDDGDGDGDGDQLHGDATNGGDQERWKKQKLDKIK